MKRIYAVTVACIVAIAMTGCQKTELAPATSAVSDDATSKSLTVYSLDGRTSTTLRLSGSPELLASLPKTSFTLVTNPELEATATTTAGDELRGFTGYIDATLLPAATKALPANAVRIDMPNMPKVASYALDVASDQSADAGITPQAVSFFYLSNWHRIRVTNLHSRSIFVDFWYFARQWRYSGYSYELFNRQWAWYQHCTRTVGAEVFYGNRYNFRVKYTQFCQ